MDSPQKKPRTTRLASIVQGIEWNDFEYKEFNDEPRLDYHPLLLIVIVPLLLAGHFLIAHTCEIQPVQYLEMTILGAMVLNYLVIIRVYELTPYLLSPSQDKRLKICCFLMLVSVGLSLFIGWNATGAVLFALGWQAVRGSNFQKSALFLLLILVGSLLMEHDKDVETLLVELLPGLAVGVVASEIFIFQDCNFYAITHQISFFISMLLPLAFAASNTKSLSGLQWLVIVAGCLIMWLTLLLGIRLVQKLRVSVSLSVTAGIMLLFTNSYSHLVDGVGAVVVVLGVGLAMRQEFAPPH